ncbi:hypothetical protein MRB53_033048 [Persea americana]|uniref:Uncharacterized protein n=1 Tax=Persea americana TaxID=3435 RepID=A0ACC2KU70_PERAE|nr:hypothetical protein MRB53_033048 [Persea americana]
MSDWCIDDLCRSHEHLTPYLGLLRRTRYDTLQLENLLRLNGYWVRVVGVMEGMTDELLAIHMIQWESPNSHFELEELNRTKAREALRRLHVRRQDRNGYAGRLAAVEDSEREMSDQMDG